MAAVLSVALLLADDEEASVAAVAAVTAEAVALPDRGPAGECRVLMIFFWEVCTCLQDSSSSTICTNED